MIWVLIVLRICIILWETNKSDKATAYFETALKLEPDNKKYQKNVAYIKNKILK